MCAPWGILDHIARCLNSFRSGVLGSALFRKNVRFFKLKSSNAERHLAYRNPPLRHCHIKWGGWARVYSLVIEVIGALWVSCDVYVARSAIGFANDRDQLAGRPGQFMWRKNGRAANFQAARI